MVTAGAGLGFVLGSALWVIGATLFPSTDPRYIKMLTMSAIGLCLVCIATFLELRHAAFGPTARRSPINYVRLLWISSLGFLLVTGYLTLVYHQAGS